MASLLKIVSTGMQDERLQPPKGQPDLGSFLTVMVKAGRYATNWTRIDFDTAPDFGKSSVIRLPTKGEMIGRIYLVTKMPDIASIQRKAYYTRKPIRLANNNYTQIKLFELESYVQKKNLNFPKFSNPTYPSPDYGLANFSGYQLDDLNIDAIYTLTFTLPSGTSSTVNAVFTFLLTDIALKDPQFTLLNTDTFVVACFSVDEINSIMFSYSYNGTVWQSSPAFSGLQSGIMRSLAYNGSQYLAVGSYSSSFKSIIIENTTELIVQPGFSISRRIAYNGILYVSVGFATDPLPPGSISYSTDGLSWVPVFNPPGLTVDYYGLGGYSVAWASSLSKWIAVGDWGYSAAGVPSGIITTSTDGITWTAPSYIQTAAYTSGPIAQTLMQTTNAGFIDWVGSTTGLNLLYTFELINTDITQIASTYISQIQTSLQIRNVSALNTARNNFLLALNSSTIPSRLNTYNTNLNFVAGSLSALLPGYSDMLVALQQFVNNINSPPQSIATQFANITAFLLQYNITNITSLIGNVASNINDFKLRIIELLRLYSLFYSSSQQLCSAITTATNLDPNGNSLTWPILSGNTIWYPVKLALDAASLAAANLSNYSSDTIPFYNANVDTAISSISTFTTNIIGPTLLDINPVVTATQLPLIQSGKATCIAVNGSQIVIGGQFYQAPGNTNYLGSLIYSSDGGTIWTFPTDPAGSSGGTQDPITNDVAWTGSIWVAAGRWVNNTISFSSDGFTWLAAINPLNAALGSAYTIALSPSDMVIGGLWSLNDGTSGSLTKASGTSLDYKWGPIVRPTQLDTNSVFAYGISYDATAGQYILVGEWSDSAGTVFGNISLSTDGITWKDAYIPADTTKVISYAYGAATNGSRWVVVGYWSDTIGGQGNTIAYSDNLTPEFYTNWSFADNVRSGYGQNIIFNSGLFIAVGSWATGYITVSFDNTGTSFRNPVSLTGVTNGTGYSITPTGTPGTYIFGGSFRNSNPPIIRQSLASININSGSGAVTLNAFTIPQGVDSAQLQLASGLAWNGLNGNLSAYVAVGKWILTDNTYATLCYSNDGLTWQRPFNPPGITQSSTNLANSVAWNGTQFVATGSWNGLTICTSTDGQTWTTATNPPNDLGNLNRSSAAIWNGSTWVAAGDWFDPLGTQVGNVTTFTYGINFSKPVHPAGAIIGTTKTVTWNTNTKKWLAGAFDTPWADNNNVFLQTTSSGILSSSTDGLNWTTPTNLNGVESVDPFSQIAVINSRVYMLGSFYYNSQSLISSTNGINWSLQPFTDNKFGTGYGIAWNGSAWTAVGAFRIRDWGNNINAPIIISSDGQTWSEPIFPVIPISPVLQQILNSLTTKISVTYTATLFGVAWNGQLWVAVGRIYVTIVTAGGSVDYTIGQIVSCSDVNNLIWTMRPIDNLETIDNYSVASTGNAVAWNGRLWVAVGEFGVIPKYITTSTDGLSWSDPFAPANVASGTATGVVWNGYLWVVVGYWQDAEGNQYNIIRSSDGQTWSSAINAIPSTNYRLNTITWNGSRFVAGGFDNNNSNGVTLVSPDGITWTYADPSLPGRGIIGLVSKRILPFTTPQPSDPRQTVDSHFENNGYTMSWVRNRIYGTGTQVLKTLTVAQSFTYTFRATQRTMWLTLGTYYSPPTLIDISMNLLTPAAGTFQTDLVGPHFGWTNNLGHSLIDSASITIGGNLVETINGQLMEVLDEFQTPLEKVTEKSRQLCRAETGFTQKTFGYSNTNQLVTTHLPFWFSRGDPGCTLPIDALNVDEVRLTVNFKPITSLYYTDSRAALPAINAEGGSLWPIANSKFYYADPDGIAIPNLEPFRQYIDPTIAFPDIQMPATYSIQDSHLMVEYIYLDKAEANRFRIADLQVPIVQHYTLNPEDTNKNTFAKIRLDIPNPTRDLFFYCQRYEAPSLNAHFLATRDLSKNQTNPYSLWWPDASGLDARFYGTLRPGFSSSGSEPIRWLALNYAETLNRYSTENVALFRSLMPSMEQRKAPWINRYYYNLPFGCQNGLNPISTPLGNANLDKVQKISLALGFHGITGDPTDSYAERFWVRTFAETYNIFRIYGGRGTMMFAY